MEQETQNQDKEVMHNLSDMNKKSLLTLPVFVFLLFVAVLGIGSGYALAGKNGGTIAVTQTPTTKESVEVGKVYGSEDAKSFKDSAEGKLEEGGIDGEGQFHLTRPGGISQTVYLSSSTVDLSLFLDREVKVWGATLDGQKAAWLMDVGRVEVTK